ncbi:MAG: hypothetical protein OES47_01165 [Acidobacteriota bacterium]|nr:hypothetical protein [Acidobacteriota bacterium]
MTETRLKEGARTGTVLERLLLGDAARLFVVPLLIVVLVLMLHGYGAMVAAADPSLDSFRTNPGKFVGRTFTVSFGKVIEVGERGFRLRDGKAAIDVIIDNADVPTGAIVSVRGVIGTDLRLAGDELRIHRWRRVKWVLGGLVLFLSSVVAGREVKLDA